MASASLANSPQIIEHINKSVPWTVYDTKWVPSSARFVAMGSYARGTGTIQVFGLNHGQLDQLLEVEKSQPFKCGTFGASSLESRRLATGDFDGRMQIWDLEEGAEYPVYQVKGHKSIINAIDGAGSAAGSGAPELVTGGRDGCVHVWDPRQKDRAVASLEPAEGQRAPDCWAVAFGNSYNDEERCVCAGYDNGDVKLFDLRTNTLRWEANVKNGVCCVEFDRKNIEMNKLVVTCLESKFRVYDMRTYNPDSGYASLTETAHKSTIWAGRHLPQNREVFMTTGGNGSLNLYKYSYPEQRVVKDAEGREKGVAGKVELLSSKTMSTQPIGSFDWSPDKEGLCVMGCFDQTVRVAVVTKLNKL